MFMLPIAQEITGDLPAFDVTSAEWWSAIGARAQDFALGFGPKVIIAGLVLWVGSNIASRIYRFVLRRTEENKRIDTTLGNFLSTMVRYVVLIATLLLAVSILGVELASVFVILSAMTLAVGLALQGSMSNVAAGLLLVLTRPYKIGDYVELCGQEGHVEDLNIFTTTLRTLDNIQVILSNGAVRGDTIRNFTSLGRRRVDIDFGIDYDDDINKAIEIIKATANQHNRVLKNPEEPWAKVSCLNDSSVDVQMRVWCDPEDYWDVRFDLLKSVKEAFDAGGINIPYPHCVEIEKS